MINMTRLLNRACVFIGVVNRLNFQKYIIVRRK